MVMGNEVTCCSTKVSLSRFSIALHKSSPVLSVRLQVSSPQHAAVRNGKAQLKYQAALLQFHHCRCSGQDDDQAGDT